MKEIFIDRSIKNLPLPTDKKSLKDKSDASFGDMLKNHLQDINRLQKEAHKAVENISIGNGKNIHETMIALEKADISFKLMMQIRDKIVKAYEEIMRLPV